MDMIISTSKKGFINNYLYMEALLEMKSWLYKLGPRVLPKTLEILRFNPITTQDATNGWFCKTTELYNFY